MINIFGKIFFAILCNHIHLYRPFYRTTQLIIVPDDQSFVEYNYYSPPAPFPSLTFGPVFKIDLLERVLRLQNEVVSLKGVSDDGNQTVSLSDICLKPLEPDNIKCTVFSLLQYYQNSLDNLKRSDVDEFGIITSDFTTHFLTCSQAPTTTNDTSDLSCFGDFGGTINPFMVLGNYSGSTYSNATALVITIVIENSNDPNKVKLGSFISLISSCIDHLFSF